MYYEEIWGMRYTLSVTRNLPWDREKMKKRIWDTQNLTSKLLAISESDAPAYFIAIAEGWKLGAAVWICSRLGLQLGARLAVAHEGWRRYNKRANDTSNPILQRSAPPVSGQESMEHSSEGGEAV